MVDSLKMVGLHICGISDELIETTKSYSNFNDELRWLWNSVYIKVLLYNECHTVVLT